MTLLTELRPVERHVLGDAARAISWSPTDRMLAIGADGRAGRNQGEPLTAPIGPDPIGCCWLSDHRVAVLDGVIGVVMAGAGAVTATKVDGAVGVHAPSWSDRGRIDRPGYCAAVGRDGLSILSADPANETAPMTIAIGPLRFARHLGGAIWATGGSDGVTIVDVALGCVDQRVELPGVVALAAAPDAGRIAAADATGAIHVLDLAHLERGSELTGYPDAVRHLGIDPNGEFVVACADDEITWWGIHDDGTVADEPECGVAHDTAITTCAVGASGLVATGDLRGVVRLWSPRLRDLPVASLHLDGEITVLSWSRSGCRLGVGTATGEVVVADIEDGDLL